MSAIAKHGSEEQKQRVAAAAWRAARLIGCFGLTEPQGGSDPAGMTTTARRDGPATGRLDHRRREALDRAARASPQVAVDLGADRRRACAASSCRPTPPGSRRPRSTASSRCAPRSSATSRSTAVRVAGGCDAAGCARALGSVRAASTRRATASCGARWARRARASRRRSARADLARGVRPADRGEPADPGEARRHGRRVREGRCCSRCTSGG